MQQAPFLPVELYGVIGWPLGQSLSPLIHNTAFQTLGRAAVYMRWEIAPERLAAFVDSFRLLRMRGCSVTIPHKVAIMPHLDEISEPARAVGAVNTLYWVPSALGIVANWKALDYTAAPPLHTILFAGEVMPTAKLNYWRAHYPQARFANLYGPTETTDICAFYELDREFRDDESLPIGRACGNCGLLILRDEFRPVDGDSAALIFRFPGDVHDPNHVVALPDAIGDDLINLFF